MAADYSGSDGFVWWIGEVEDNKDPLQLGRVKVRIYGWNTGGNDKENYLKKLPTEALPWANCLVPTDKAQVKQVGTMSNLQEGAMVVGFFMDGEQGQIPMVMGAYHTTKDVDLKSDTFAADPTQANADADSPPAAETLTGQKVQGGNTAPKVVAAPDGPGMAKDESRGALGEAAAALANKGDATSNPQVVPSERQGVADGVKGPAGEGFLTDLKRMLTELANLTTMLAKGKDGNYISLITGKKVLGDPVLDRLSKVMNFIYGGISGILAPLKNALAEIIVKVVNIIVKAISSFVPMIVITTILSFLGEILDIFCIPHPAWLGIVQGAISDVANFANQLANAIVDKIADVLAGVLDRVAGITDRILQGVQNALAQTADIINTVISAVEVAQSLGSAVSNLGKILSVDFSKLDWGSLLGIILAILKAIFGKLCDRPVKDTQVKGWYPLVGTTSCGDLGTTLASAGYRNIDQYRNASGSGAGYFQDLFTNLDPYRQATQTFLNGTSIIEDATPGKEKRIVSGPGAVSTIEDSVGNVHKNVPNNDTRIIGKDCCETVKGNKTMTIEGDFHLKVMGNMHLEVIGAYNENTSNGPQTEATGSSKEGAPTASADNAQGATNSGSNNAANLENSVESVTLAEKYGFYPPIPREPGADKWGRRPGGSQLSQGKKDDKEQGSAALKHGDHTIGYTGDVKIQGANVNVTAVRNTNICSQVTKIEGNVIDLVADGEIDMEANWITSIVKSGHLNIINIFPSLIPPPVSGIFNIVNGSIIDLTTDVPIPAATPPIQMRISFANTNVGGMADIVLGTTGAHFTFINTATGGIAEIVNSAGGAIINQVSTGLASYGVGTGFMATGCAAGPHQVYGLPLLLN